MSPLPCSCHLFAVQSYQQKAGPDQTHVALCTTFKRRHMWYYSQAWHSFRGRVFSCKPGFLASEVWLQTSLGRKYKQLHIPAGNSSEGALHFHALPPARRSSQANLCTSSSIRAIPSILIPCNPFQFLSLRTNISQHIHSLALTPDLCSLEAKS